MCKVFSSRLERLCLKCHTPEGSCADSSGDVGKPARRERNRYSPPDADGPTTRGTSLPFRPRARSNVLSVTFTHPNATSTSSEKNFDASFRMHLFLLENFPRILGHFVHFATMVRALYLRRALQIIIRFSNEHLGIGNILTISLVTYYLYYMLEKIPVSSDATRKVVTI